MDLKEDHPTATSSGLEVEESTAPAAEIIEKIAECYQVTVEQMIENLAADESTRTASGNLHDIEVMANEPTVINLVNVIISGAVRERAGRAELAYHWRAGERPAEALRASVEAGLDAERARAFRDALHHFQFEIFGRTGEDESFAGFLARLYDLRGFSVEARQARTSRRPSATSRPR